MNYQRDSRQIFSIRRFKAYGTASALLAAAILSAHQTVSADDLSQPTVPSSEPQDNAQGEILSTVNNVETENFIVMSEESTAPVASVQPVEATPAPVASSPTVATPEAAPAASAETASATSRQATIGYTVRYVNGSGQTVYQIAKSKTVETTEKTARTTITESANELFSESELATYHLATGTASQTHTLVEGAENIITFVVVGEGETSLATNASAPSSSNQTEVKEASVAPAKENAPAVTVTTEEKKVETETVAKKRTAGISYTVQYVDVETGAVLYSQRRLTPVETTDTLAKTQVIEKADAIGAIKVLEGYRLDDEQSETITTTITEKAKDVVMFKVRKAGASSVIKENTSVFRVNSPVTSTGPYITIDNETIPGTSWRDGQYIFAGNNLTYKFRVGLTRTTDSAIELTPDAKALGFTYDPATRILSGKVAGDVALGTKQVGVQLKSDPSVKAYIEFNIAQNFGKKGGISGGHNRIEAKTPTSYNSSNKTYTYDLKMPVTSVTVGSLNLPYLRMMYFSTESSAYSGSLYGEIPTIAKFEKISGDADVVLDWKSPNVRQDRGEAEFTKLPRYAGNYTATYRITDSSGVVTTHIFKIESYEKKRDRFQ